MLTVRWIGAMVVVTGIALVVYAIKTGVTNAPTVEPFEIPSDNPISAPKVRLGRHLFYDRRLSFNATLACADCHRQEFAFSDPRPHSVGATGELTTRNAMTLTNVAYNGRYTWVDDTIKTLERQALMPLLQAHPLEMGVAGNESAVMTRFRDDPNYTQLFAEAFPGDGNAITLPNAVKAISSFERTLISLDAPYDRFTAGNVEAMTDSAKRGLTLFRSDRLKCSHCHGGINFRMTDSNRNDPDHTVAYYNTGLFNFPVKGDASPDRAGRAINASIEEGRFKAPTLRNVATSAPYLHDGSVATLADVIDIYAAGGRVVTSGPGAGDGRISPFKSPLITGFAITSEEKRDLIAFLESLTDRSFLANPDLASPFIR